MKRRSFIRNLGILSTTVSLAPSCTVNPRQNTQTFRHAAHLTLKEFAEEHEEYPSLATNHEGDSWLFSLRRLPYPEDKEVISAFKNGKQFLARNRSCHQRSRAIWVSGISLCPRRISGRGMVKVCGWCMDGGSCCGSKRRSLASPTPLNLPQENI